MKTVSFIWVLFLLCACSTTNTQSSSDKKCFDVKQCVKVLQVKVSREWYRPSNLEGSLDLILHIKLSRTGDLEDVQISSSSGNATHDETAIIAVRNAAPFPEIEGLQPEIYRQVFKELKLRFVLGNE